MSAKKMWSQGPFNVDHWKKKVIPKLPLLIKHLDPQAVLPYLPTLTSTDKEEVICRQQSNGKTYAAQVLLNNLERRPRGRGYIELMYALMEPEIDLIMLALEIDQEFAEKIAREKGIDLNDYIEQDSDDEVLYHNTFAASGALSPVTTEVATGPVVNHYHQYGDKNVLTVNPPISYLSRGPADDEELLTDDCSSDVARSEYTVTETDSATAGSDITDTSLTQCEQESSYDAGYPHVSDMHQESPELDIKKNPLLEDGGESSENEDGQTEDEVSKSILPESEYVGSMYKNIDHTTLSMVPKKIGTEESEISEETEAKSVKRSSLQQVEEEECVDSVRTAVKEISSHNLPSSSVNVMEKTLSQAPQTVSLGTLPPSRILEMENTDQDKHDGQAGAIDVSLSAIAVSLSEKEEYVPTLPPSVTDSVGDSRTDTSSTFCFSAGGGNNQSYTINGFTIHPRAKEPEVPVGIKVESREGIRNEGNSSARDDTVSAMENQNDAGGNVPRISMESNDRKKYYDSVEDDNKKDQANLPVKEDITIDGEELAVNYDSVETSDIGGRKHFSHEHIPKAMGSTEGSKHSGVVSAECGNLEEQTCADTIVSLTHTDVDVCNKPNTEKPPMIVVTSVADEFTSIESKKGNNKETVEGTKDVARKSIEQENKDEDVTDRNPCEKPPTGPNEEQVFSKKLLDDKEKPSRYEPRKYAQYLLIGGAVILGSSFVIWKFSKKSHS